MVSSQSFLHGSPFLFRRELLPLLHDLYPLRGLLRSLDLRGPFLDPCPFVIRGLDLLPCPSDGCALRLDRVILFLPLLRLDLYGLDFPALGGGGLRFLGRLLLGGSSVLRAVINEGARTRCAGLLLFPLRRRELFRCGSLRRPRSFELRGFLS